jgi:hypothetical protein
MEMIMWLFMRIREDLWGTLPESTPEGLSVRSTATLDVIHVVNEIIAWAERSHYGDSGEILPVASLERQAFYDVLNAAIDSSLIMLANPNATERTDLYDAMVAHTVALDTVASMTLRPHYVTRIKEIGDLAIFAKEETNDGAGSGPAVADDDR